MLGHTHRVGADAHLAAGWSSCGWVHKHNCSLIALELLLELLLSLTVENTLYASAYGSGFCGVWRVWDAVDATICMRCKMATAWPACCMEASSYL